MARSSSREPTVEIDEGDPFYFNLTSGTTGLPKCYVINHYNCTAGNSMFATFDLTSRDVVLTVFPMFGRIGCGWAIASIQPGGQSTGLAAGLGVCRFGIAGIHSRKRPGQTLPKHVRVLRYAGDRCADLEHTP
ncbi:long-chain-fatty-acid--CoA ligase [compost metagenome]